MANNSYKLLIYFGITLCFLILEANGSKIKPSASALAKRTGAAQFEEYYEDDVQRHIESGKNRRVSRELFRNFSETSDDDFDYEVYQGVVGRPGIDFPVLIGIPATNFNCRKHGNGYFADLDTDCQVFHICDGGRKISFLCPNGTIFRQTDLICDWWFKVDCAEAPEHYAESSEILARDQTKKQQKDELAKLEVARVKSVTPTPNNTKNRTIRPKVQELPQERAIRDGSGETYDGSSYENSGESYEYEQAYRRRRPYYRRTRPTYRSRSYERSYFRGNGYSGESQEFAESASFVGSRNGFNGYNYPAADRNLKTKQQKSVELFNEDKIANSEKYVDETDQPTTVTKIPSTTVTTPKFTAYQNEQEGIKKSTTIAPTTYSRRGSTTYLSSLEGRRLDRKQHSNKGQTVANTVNRGDFKSTTAIPISSTNHHTSPKTYATARRIDNTRTTPYYTPTVPSIVTRVDSVSRSTSGNTYLPEVPSTTTERTSASDHAIEMIKTLKNIDLKIKTKSATVKKPSERIGLVIPPSSGPETLHSLAQYFVTASENQTKSEATTTYKPISDSTTEKTPVTTEVNFSDDTQTVLTTLLSEKTVSKYRELFPDDPSKQTTTQTVLIPTEPTLIDMISNDLEGQYSKNPVFAAAGTPQIRELAQVFTHALSAYLQDPETFRRLLSEIRPTEPPQVQSNEILSSRTGRTEDFSSTASQYSATTANPETTDDLEVLDFSDVTQSTYRKEVTSVNNDFTTESSIFSTTTYEPANEDVTTLINPKTNRALSSADKTPASQLITDSLEQTASTYYSQQSKTTKLDVTTPTNNPVAMMVNGGLDASTMFPYVTGESIETLNDTIEYINIDDAQSQNITSKPKGFGLKQNSSIEDSAEDYSSSSPTDLDATTIASNIPTLSSDLELPFDSYKFSSKEDRLDLDANEFHIENEENLQQSQSQSLINGNNDIKDDNAKGTKSEKFKTTSKSAKVVSTRLNNEDYDSTETTARSSSVRGFYITQTIPTTTLPPSTVADAFEKTTISDSGKLTTNPWTSLSFTEFLDPVTINDELAESAESKTVSPSPFTYLPKSTTKSPDTDATTTINIESTTEYEIKARRGKSFSTTPTPTAIDFSDDSLMQQRAKEMFGGLNETSANSLMKVMKKADKNKMVKRLILLLIQTCDDDYNKTVEESRTALLNALIGMDHSNQLLNDDVQIINAHQVRRGKSLATATTIKPTETIITEIPDITTYRSEQHEKFTSLSPTINTESSTIISTSVETESTTQTTAEEIKTTIPSTTKIIENNDFISTLGLENTSEHYTTSDDTTTETTKTPDSNEQDNSNENSSPAFIITVTDQPTTVVPTKSPSKRISKSLEEFLALPSSNIPTAEKHSDARALELLRSLYTLATKWGSR